MAINMQRARDHGLPDYNTARFAYGLVKLTGFEQINPMYGIDPVSCLSLSTIVLNSRDWSEIIWLPKNSHFKINLPIGFYPKKLTGMH